MSLSLESIEAMKVADLKTACTNLGLPATGVKADLQARLKAHISVFFFFERYVIVEFLLIFLFI
jgi:hypothetical protein